MEVVSLFVVFVKDVVMGMPAGGGNVDARVFLLMVMPMMEMSTRGFLIDGDGDGDAGYTQKQKQEEVVLFPVVTKTIPIYITAMLSLTLYPPRLNPWLIAELLYPS